MEGGGFAVVGLIQMLRQQLPQRKRGIAFYTRTKSADDSDCVMTEGTRPVLDLRCPLSLQRQKCPVRTLGCQHLQTCDLASLLGMLNGSDLKRLLRMKDAASEHFKCPVCQERGPLYVDEFVSSTLNQFNAETNRVAIDASGAACPVTLDRSIVDLTGNDSVCVAEQPKKEEAKDENSNILEADSVKKSDKDRQSQSSRGSKRGRSNSRSPTHQTQKRHCGTDSKQPQKADRAQAGTEARHLIRSVWSRHTVSRSSHRSRSSSRRCEPERRHQSSRFNTDRRPRSPYRSVSFRPPVLSRYYWSRQTVLRSSHRSRSSSRRRECERRHQSSRIYANRRSRSPYRSDLFRHSRSDPRSWRFESSESSRESERRHRSSRFNTDRRPRSPYRSDSFRPPVGSRHTVSRSSHRSRSSSRRRHTSTQIVGPDRTHSAILDPIPLAMGTNARF